MQQFHELAHDSTSGATELIQRMLGIVESLVLAGQPGTIEDGLAYLQNYQLSMPSLHAVVNTLQRDLLPLARDPKKTTDALEFIASLQQILDDSEKAIARNFLNVLKEPVKVLTFSRSSTVVGALRNAHEAGKISHLYVLESRPLLEGVKTVRDCALWGIPCTLAVDAAVGELVQQVDCAIIGADGISSDSFLLNKTGTLPLAVCCREFDVPLYVLTDSLKFSPHQRDEIPLEEHPESEVIEKSRKDAFKVINVYFDWTPISLVSRFITENGIAAPDAIDKLISVES